MASYQRPSTAGPVRRPALARQGTAGSVAASRRLFLVAVDGSELSMRGVRLAAYLMLPERDRIKVVMVDMPKRAAPASVEESLALAEADRSVQSPHEVLMTARSELIKCGCPSEKVLTEELSLDHPGTGGADTLQAVAELLVMLSNRMLRRQSGMLVLGAAGKGKAQKGSARKAVDMGPVAQYVLKNAKCAVTLCKEAQLGLDSPLRATRFALHICVCADGSTTSRGAFDQALRFCKPGDKLSVLHIESAADTPNSGESLSSARESKQLVQRYWEVECEKISFTCDGLAVNFAPVQKPRGSTVVDCILRFVDANRCQLCVMGSVELIRQQGVVLGSVAQAVANRSRAHCCIVKQYGQEESIGF